MSGCWRTICHVLLVLLLATCWHGCSGSGQSQDETSPTAAALVAREAPQDWPEFESWVIAEIQKTRESIPLPADPVLAKPEWPCRRLDQLLGRAEVTCDWQADDSAVKPLATLGPFRSDEPHAKFKAEKSFDRQFGWGVLMTIKECGVQCEDVGRISIEISAPYGHHVDLRWSLGGLVRVPIPDNRQPWRLDVLTDGLTDWSGPLESLVVRSDGFEENGVFEIRSLSFYGHENVFVKPVGARRVSLEDRLRSAIYAHCPAEVKFANLSVPADGRLSVGLAAQQPDRPEESAESVAEVDFEVIVEHGGQREVVFEKRLSAGGTWTDVSLSLSRWAGQDVSLSLNTHSDQPDVVALWGSPTVYQPVTDPPIMILYLIDALAAKHCSLYGYERPTTPNLDSLAQRGVWFANMYCNSPVTVTSVPDIHLSMPAERHGVYHASISAPAELVTIADALSAAGFATASFITNANAGARQGMDQGFDEYSPRTLFHWDEKSSVDRSVPIEDVLEWFERHRDRPAFVYIHTCEPHAPYTPPPELRGRFDPYYRGMIDGTFSGRTGFFAARSQRDIDHVRALYDEECLYADTRLGEFLGKLKEASLLKRVNLFVIADHGQELQEHGHWGHGLGLYNEVLRVPLIAVGPLITARGRRDLQACLYDIMPTILDLFDLPQPYQLSGTSLRTLMQTGAGAPPAELSPQRTTITSHHRYVGRGHIEYAVVEARKWKLHYRFMLVDQPNYPTPARFELYDLENDPDEQHDLIAERQDIARGLMCKLVAYAREQHPYSRLSEGGLSFDADQLQELIQLGYIETTTSKPLPPQP